MSASATPPKSHESDNVGRKKDRLSKSQRLGLLHPYDWSNPDIPDDVLIRKVLAQHEFEDVVPICLHYGWQRVSREAKALQGDPSVAVTLARQLKNIKTAMLQTRVYAIRPDRRWQH